MCVVAPRSLLESSPAGTAGRRRGVGAILGPIAVVLAMLGAALSTMGVQAWDSDRWMAQATRLGSPVQQQAQALAEAIQQGARLDDEARLQLFNQFFNRRILFREDTEVWGQVDYWASPLEMLARGAGDCEDYAIGKYFALVASGMPAARLRLVYVRAVLGGPGGVQQAHMVLAYYPPSGAEPLILDNLIGDIRPASRRQDLTPVFSFNSEGLWQGTQGPGAGDPTVRLSRWREVLAKAREQGFL